MRRILVLWALGGCSALIPFGCGEDDTAPATVASTGGSAGASAAGTAGATAGAAGEGAGGSAGMAGSGGSAGVSGGGGDGPDLLDGSVEIDAALDAGVECCPASDEPACTMLYGGTKTSTNLCSPTVNGMPYPDAAWQLLVDEQGCPYWQEPASRGPWDCCGCAVPSDAALDAGLCDMGTADIPDVGSAVTVCEAYESCHICVETEDSQGNPTSYHVYPSDLCPCPDPEVVDAG